MASNRDPAFLFYSADFIVGTLEMSMEERGQYITLICLQHQKGHLSLETMERMVGKIGETVLEKFQQDAEGKYFNSRTEEEIEKRTRFVAARQANGALGGRPKKPRQNLSVNSSLTNEEARENLGENENINENINSNDNVVTKAVRHKYGEYLNVLLSNEELEKVKAEFPIDWSERIERLSEYIATSGKKYKSHIAVIRSWARRDTEAPAPTQDQHQTNGRPTQEAARFSTFDPQRALQEAIARSDSKYG